ncbi:MAG: hypothetical protein LBI87_06005 [Candidatus Accumulibacter sp.]|jgi:hypothetical protein|nr:hypothetical protein [Accumulibacter sp.]
MAKFDYYPATDDDRIHLLSAFRGKLQASTHHVQKQLFTIAPGEIAVDAVACVRSGTAIVHVRDENGRNGRNGRNSLATGIHACRSQRTWKGFAYLSGYYGRNSGLKAGFQTGASFTINASYVAPEASPRPRALFDHVDKGELGVKTGKGFFDYQGRSAAEVCKKRDKLLFRVFKATRDLIEEKI